jgi:multiple sugar transport system ATP-binding protein
MAGIDLQDILKEFPNGVCAVDGVSLKIEDGEFMVLVGPSGCGKTTLLRCIAGLEEITDGAVLIGERDVTDVAPKNRDIAMVFQNYALYPHMTVRKNIAFGLKVRGTPRAEVAERVTEAARLLGLEDLLDRRPLALSGGQRQRVAMGRAIARRPAVYLMDEPLSNLDAKLRVRVRADLAQLHARLGVTTVYVTHDQIEAMTLADRAAVMNKGQIQQVDTPQALYWSPVNLFVAAFIGSPSMNLLEAVVEDGSLKFASFSLPLDELGDDARKLPSRVILGVRPEHLAELHGDETGAWSIEAHVSVVENLGAETLVFFPLDVAPVEPEDVVRVREGEEQEGLIAADNRTVFTARLPSTARARVGSRIRLALNPSLCHFFEPERGNSILVRRPAAEDEIPLSLAGPAA